ncbi:formimidoylglutamase [Comamonas humi]
MSSIPTDTTWPWTGRVDTEETGPTTRWHQRVRPFDARSAGGVALMGFAVDEGVRRNGGRQGAAGGPKAMRSVLANLALHDDSMALWDAGDVSCPDGRLEAAQSALAGRVAQALAQGCRPLVLGGGHEVAWGSFQGLAQHLQAQGSQPRRVLVVNLDAHFDLRTASEANSGTPFRQIQGWCAQQGWPFEYRVFGINRDANTTALFQRAHDLNVPYWLDDALQTPEGAAQACAALARDLQACDAAYLTVCLDVLPMSLVPGVSAPAALGVPLPVVQGLIDTVLASGKLALADIAELNPAFDRDAHSARVAARIAARIALGAHRQ